MMVSTVINDIDMLLKITDDIDILFVMTIDLMLWY